MGATADANRGRIPAPVEGIHAPLRGIFLRAFVFFRADVAVLRVDVAFFRVVAAFFRVDVAFFRVDVAFFRVGAAFFRGGAVFFRARVAAARFAPRLRAGVEAVPVLRFLRVDAALRAERLRSEPVRPVLGRRPSSCQSPSDGSTP
jgi:hypothetical protein